MKRFVCSVVFGFASVLAAQTGGPGGSAPSLSTSSYLPCTFGTNGPVCSTKGTIVAGVPGAETSLTGTGVMFPDGSVQTSAATGGSGGGGGGGTTAPATSTAQINEIDNLTAAASVTAVRPQGGTGSKGSKKDSTNCLSAWTYVTAPAGGYPGSYSGNGHRYCTQAEATAAHAAQTSHSLTPDSYGYITLTQSGAGSISPVNSNGAGGSDAPVSMTTEYGLTTYDSLCNNNLLTAATNIPGLALPACGTGVTALLAETTDGTYPAASTLWPTNFPTTQADLSDHWLRSGMFMMPSVSSTTRLEFDINKIGSDGGYEGPGTSFNVTSGRVDFLPQANNFIGHGTCSGTWCPMNLNLQAGSTAMPGCPGLEVCALTSGHWYAYVEKGHLPGTTVTEYESQDGKTIPRTVYQYDELDLADCGTSGTSCPADYARYTLTDPGNNNAPPQGYAVQYGWPAAFDTQWQLYPHTTSTTSTLNIVNDVTQWYQLVKGTGSTNYVSAPANLGDFEANNNTNNSDTSSGDSTTLSCTGGVVYDSAWAVSTPASFNFNAVGDECTATLPTAETTLTQRIYLGTNQLSTSSTGSSQMMELKSGSTTVLEIYANDGSNNLVLYLPSTTTSSALTCTLDPSTSSQATVTDSKDYWDITWQAGTSTATGTVLASFDGATPTNANCSWLNTGIDTTSFSSGVVTGVTSVIFGYLTDSGTVQNWNFDMDMIGLSSGTTFLGAALPVTSTTTTYQTNLGITQSTSGGLTTDIVPNPVQTPAITAGNGGTFVCTAGGAITIGNAAVDSTSDITVSMVPGGAGGTISTPPAFQSVTSGVGFTVLCGAADTSSYRYRIWN